MDTDKPVETSRARILVVDDNAENLSVLGDFLRPHYHVLAAPSGERALQIAVGARKPDLILLDVLMPGMDGYDVLARLRDNPATRDIPVIFVTGLDSIEDEEKGFELGAVDYVAKPYRPPIVLARVRIQLELKRHRDSLKDQAAFLDAEVARRGEALRNSELKHRLLFESSRDALMTLAPPSWQFTGANQATLQLFGASSVAEFTALGPWNVSPERQPDGRPSSEKAPEMIATAMRAGSHFFEWEHQRLDGETFAADVLLTRMEVGKEVFLQATVRDISERKWLEGELATKLLTLTLLNDEYKAINDKLIQTQSQLLQSEKLASIGLLAAGVAHEINNPIGFVNSNLCTLKSYVDNLLSVIDAYEKAEGNFAGSTSAFAAVDAIKAKVDLPYLKSDVAPLVAESRDGLNRVKKIIQSLKDFSRVDTNEAWREEDIRQGIESTLNVVWNELKYKCEVRKEYGDIPTVECLLSHLNQVFMNLLVNAAQAIEDHGVITIRTGIQGNEVWVEIADTGKGIAPEHLPHIFDPFFTTKPVGKATGLGLSVSYSIVQKHHGRIEVESAVGKGTAFRIILPVKQPDENNE